MGQFWQEVAIAIGITVAGYIISWVANQLLTRVVARLTRRTATHLDDVILEAANPPLRLTIFLGAVEIGFSRLSSIPAGWLALISAFFFALYSLLVFLFLWRLVSGLFRWYGLEVVHRTETLVDDQFLELFRRLALALLTAIMIVVVLGRYGIEVTALVTTLGIGSLAIALAAQETLGDMFSGLTILVDQPFKVGDRVELLELGTWGDVTEIGLRSTRILTTDNRTVSVPNSVIGKGLVVNFSVPSALYRIETTVGVAYDSDVAFVRSVLETAVRRQEWVVADRPVDVLFVEFGDSALNFRVRCFIDDYLDRWRVLDRLNSVIFAALSENKISIPFPQRDLHIVSSSVPFGGSRDA
ncbi:MAG: mechanosensitive ion channel family protein [Anaerolineales bacterium]|nr:mechanosensitive ion channel family protein [Anaerolineales bacterium]